MSTFEPRRPFGPRDPNDGWAEGPAGRFWGRGGAAGLLAYDPAQGVLLQHRVAWSDQGDTWGLPGGARHVDESAVDGALREAGEEAGVPAEGHRLLFTHTFDVGYWSYTTVAVEVTESFEAMITDPESADLRWVAIEDIDDYPLHPGFARAWPLLREQLTRPSALVVDAANVVGATPDGWWKDRPAATERLLDALAVLRADGLPGDWLGLESIWHMWPRIVVVTEGEARAATPSSGSRLEVVQAPEDGDSAIVQHTVRLGTAAVTVVTSDGALGERVRELGARTVGVRKLLDLL